MVHYTDIFLNYNVTSTLAYNVVTFGDNREILTVRLPRYGHQIVLHALLVGQHNIIN